MLTRLLFAASCVLVPIVWGVVVNWLFQRLRNPRPVSPDEPEPAAEEPPIEYYI